MKHFSQAHFPSPVRPIIAQFLLICFPLLAVVAGVALHQYQKEAQRELEFLKKTHLERVHQIDKSIRSDLKSVFTDLMILVSHHELQQYLDFGEEEHLDILGRELLMFSAFKGLYDQVRFIDADGMEVVRVNLSGETPSVLPKEDLQNKSDRYYF